MDVLSRSGGRLVELRHTGARNLSFSLQGNDFSIDPNRIFASAGVRATLTAQSRFTDSAARAVERFATALLAVYAIERADAVIALHNNTDRKYSALSYTAGNDLARDAELVFIRDGSGAATSICPFPVQLGVLEVPE